MREEGPEEVVTSPPAAALLGHDAAERIQRGMTVRIRGDHQPEPPLLLRCSSTLHSVAPSGDAPTLAAPLLSIDPQSGKSTGGGGRGGGQLYCIAESSLFSCVVTLNHIVAMGYRTLLIKRLIQSLGLHSHFGIWNCGQNRP